MPSLPFFPFSGRRRSGRGLVFGLVLCSVLPAERPEGGPAGRQHVAIGTIFFVVFGWLSDKIGRKPIIMAGLLLSVLTYFPLFKAMTQFGNLAPAQAKETIRAMVTAGPADCTFQFGGLLPATAFATSAAKGDIYYGLWYPIIIAAPPSSSA